MGWQNGGKNKRKGKRGIGGVRESVTQPPPLRRLSVFPVPMHQNLNMSKDGAVRNCGVRLRDLKGL